MENVTIVEDRINEIEFEINIQGANKKEPTVRFVIEDKSLNYTVDCKHGEDDNWSVTVPIIPNLTKKSYPFKLEVIVDGYYFEPFHGTADIIPEPDVKTKSATNSHPAEPVVKTISVKKDTAKKPKKKVVKKKPTKQVPVKEETPIVDEAIPQVVDVVNDEPCDIIEEEPTSGFKDMADMWLSREKPVVTEKDKTVKGIIKNLKDEPVMKPTTSSPIKQKEAVAETVLDQEAIEKMERDIKVRAILNSTT